MFKYNCFFFIVGCIVFANGEVDISNINVNDIQQHLPPEIANIANSNFTLEDAKALFQNKCIETAGEKAGKAAYKAIESGGPNLMECVTNILNFTAIQTEIEIASPKGDLDIVFNKYCNKRDNLLQCIDDFNKNLEPCLDKDENESRELFMRITRSLLNFVCHKGGEQIALFIAEKGPECLESKREDIQNCVNSTFSKYLPKEGINNVKSLPKLVINKKQCEEIEHLEACVVSKLETCVEITPANIIESMFRFIKNETICRTSTLLTAAKQSTNSARNLLNFNEVMMLIMFFLVSTVFKRFLA